MSETTSMGLRILVSDAMKSRREAFRVKGVPHSIRMVENLAELEEQLQKNYWDLLFVTTYMDPVKYDWSAPLPAIINAFKTGRLVRGVVLCGAVESDCKSQAKNLTEAKVPWVYYPYSQSVGPHLKGVLK